MKWYSPLALAVFMFWMAFINPHIWNWFIILALLCIFYSFYIVNIRDAKEDQSGYCSDDGSSNEFNSSANLHNSGY